MSSLEKPHSPEPVEPVSWLGNWAAALDLRPIPTADRTWSRLDYIAYFVLTEANASNYATTSALLSLGLDVRQALICIILGQLLVVPFSLLNGQIGARERISMPIIQRASLGIVGSAVAVALRFLTLSIWYTLQSWYGGQCLKVAIGAVWPSFLRLRNTLPVSTPMETNDLIAWLLFNLLVAPLTLLDPQVVKKPFRYGAAITTLTICTLLIWALAKQGNGGPLLTRTPHDLTGIDAPESLPWTMLFAINSYVGTQVCLVVLIANITRFAERPSMPLLAQGVVLPLTDILVALFATIITSCAAGFYKDSGLLWNPAHLLGAIQQHSPSIARIPVFCAAASFVVGQLGIEVLGNAYSGSIMLNSLFPWIPIRFGGLPMVALGMAAVPWYYMQSTMRILEVFTILAVVFGPMACITSVDYFVVRRGKLDTPQLYVLDHANEFWYWHGVNYRAVAAYVLGLVFVLPGFSYHVTGTHRHSGWFKIYEMNCMASSTIAVVTYLLLNKLWPVQRQLSTVKSSDVEATEA